MSTVRYSPDGKGGYIGTRDSAPGVGDTVTFNPNKVAAGGGSPEVGGTLEYSPDGKGGYIGAVAGVGGVNCLWYWVGVGFDRTLWEPYGTVTMDEAWEKRLVHCNHDGGYPKIKTSNDQIPHIFYFRYNYPPQAEKTYLVHIYLDKAWWYPDSEWVREEVELPAGSGYYYGPALEYDKWDVKIGADNKIHICLSAFLTDPLGYVDQLYITKDPVTEEWSSFETIERWLTTNYSQHCASMDLDVSGNPHVAWRNDALGQIREGVRGSGGSWLISNVRATTWSIGYGPVSLKNPRIICRPGTTTRYVIDMAGLYYQAGRKTYYYPVWYQNTGSGWSVLSETVYGTNEHRTHFDACCGSTGSPRVFAQNLTHRQDTTTPLLFEGQANEFHLWYDPGSGWWDLIGPSQSAIDQFSTYNTLVVGGDAWDEELGHIVYDENWIQMITTQHRKLFYRYANMSTGVFYDFPDLETDVRGPSIDCDRVNWQPHVCFLK